MRRRKADLRRRVSGKLQIGFTETRLTSYAGLELIHRYIQKIQLNRSLRRHLSSPALSGDFGMVPMVRLLLGLLFIGGRRLRHVSFLQSDPLLQRFCFLSRPPSSPTLSRWLKRFTEPFVERLRRLNAEIIARVVLTLPIRTLTCDVDGTVLSTGLTVERAFRGYNPHHRKVPSDYPISAYLAETGHFLRVKNRSGNVHDGKASTAFLRDVFRQIVETLGSDYRLHFRMDGAFFTQAVLRLMESKKAGYAIKVPFWKWIDLQSLIVVRQRWQRVNGEVGAFEKTLDLEPWGMRIRVVIYRKKVHHRTRRNYQLDLFDPDDGTWEYSAVATNLSYEPKKLWNFMAGRGVHEKAIGLLKSGLAFDTIPTHHYGANSAWQQIVVLAHNLLINFQIETGVRKRSRSQKRTALHVLKSAQTLRFEIAHRAGQILRPRGITVLRLQKNPLTENLFSQINQRLQKTA